MKYNFIQFIAALDSDNFDKPEESWILWATKFVESIPEVMKTQLHGGDCTKAPSPCPFCVYENMLSDYREYYFDEEKWRTENSI